MLQRFCQANPWGRGNSDPWEVPQIFCTHAKVEIMGMISNFATGSLSSLFYHCYQIWYKDCLKYENRMWLVGPPFLAPPPHHLHWHYFDITKLPYQKQYPCYKSIRKWKFHGWVDFRIYDGVPPFLEWIWRNPIFLSIGGEFMMSAHHMMGFHHMMCVLPIKW